MPDFSALITQRPIEPQGIRGKAVVRDRRMLTQPAPRLHLLAPERVAAMNDRNGLACCCSDNRCADCCNQIGGGLVGPCCYNFGSSDNDEVVGLAWYHKFEPDFGEMRSEEVWFTQSGPGPLTSVGGACWFYFDAQVQVAVRFHSRPPYDCAAVAPCRVVAGLAERANTGAPYRWWRPPEVRPEAVGICDGSVQAFGRTFLDPQESCDFVELDARYRLESLSAWLTIRYALGVARNSQQCEANCTRCP